MKKLITICTILLLSSCSAIGLDGTPSRFRSTDKLQFVVNGSNATIENSTITPLKGDEITDGTGTKKIYNGTSWINLN